MSINVKLGSDKFGTFGGMWWHRHGVGILCALSMMLLGYIIIGDEFMRLMRQSMPERSSFSSSPVQQSPLVMDSFPPEWKVDVIESLKHFEKHRNRSISSEGLKNALERNKYGYLMRIEDGKLYLNVERHIRLGQTWQDILDRGSVPPHMCRIIELVCARNFTRNIDAVINIGDEPRGFYDTAPYPLFSWTRTNRNTDLLIPYHVTFNSLPRKPEDTSSCDFSEAIERDWRKKTDLAIWRGSTTGAHFTVDNWRDQWRPKTVKFCLENTDICDARISKYNAQSEPSATADMKKELGEEMSMPMEQQANYRYALVLDGNSAPSSRMRRHLEGTSLMVKQDSPFVEFFYSSLRPYYHYLPFSRSIKDLKSVIEWARDHDEHVKQMVKSSREFSCKYMNREVVMDYVEFVFEEYAKRFEGVRAPIATEDMTLARFDTTTPSQLCPNLADQGSCPFFESTASLT